MQASLQHPTHSTVPSIPPVPEAIADDESPQTIIRKVAHGKMSREQAEKWLQPRYSRAYETSTVRRIWRWLFSRKN